MKTVNHKHATGFFFTLTAIVFVLICHHFAFVPACRGAQNKGIKVVIADSSGQRVGLYEGSYALLIGISDYTAGWPDLGSVPGELDRVETVLKKQGFEVIRVMNPDSRGLNRAYKDFIDRYGYNPGNRLLFFFSGHGHTRKGGAKGYLVPADAPNPRRDERGFLRKALPMNMILAWSRQLEARHALFLFDSCFSGTVFKAKALPPTPPHISRATSLPVRQYITAGDAGETVPAESVFTPAFIDALEYGWGDLNRDGYVSGTELGLYLQEKVPAHSRQNPQYGKIRDYALARGDFVFQLASSGATVSRPVPSRKTILSVSANVTGARVIVDGRTVGQTPLEDKPLSPGTHRLRVEAEGYDAYEKRIQVESGRAVSLYVDLSEETPSRGRLFVETTPEEARVRILNIGPAFYQ
ncbi:MAG: PEGA domain-containing protein, partial [Deltaproteobacteria bacterium]|nr:PEGA domain-containing protein [Deltaproteobacteria bacterium]